MGHPFLELIRKRVSVERFDPERTLDESEIRALVEDACEAPSSFNIQHWRWIAVRRAEDKRRLQAAAYGQQQVADAAVTFIVLGDLDGVDTLPEVLKPSVEQGVLTDSRAKAWIDMARKIYADPRTAREEAIRSCSLAAMTLMLAAEARGYGAGALSGFDPEQVKRDFGIGERYVPAMLLAVGYPASCDETRKPRLPLASVLAFDRWRDF